MNTTPDLMNALGWSLLHFLWQGAAIAALAGALMFVFRKPATRYLLGIAALALMIASFGTTLSSLYAPDDAFSAARAPAAALASPQDAIATPLVAMLSESQAAIVSDTVPSFAQTWVARIWLAGVFLLALRIAFGLLWLEHLRRRSLVSLSPALVARFQALQERVGISRAIRYCECRLVGVPAVIGFFRPIVLLPVRALTGLSPEQLDAVIAHELGHIKRFDVLVNFFQVVTETLFFFHPAVWWLNKRIRADREDCCDDIAIAACGGKVGFARALAEMEGWRNVPEFAMAAAGGPVAARVARLLGIQRAPEVRAAGVVAASVVLFLALATGAATLGVVQSAYAQDGVDAAADVDSPPPPAPAAPASAVTPTPKKPAASPRSPKPPRAPDAPEPTVPAAPAAPRAPNPAAPTASANGGYIDQMRAAGLGDLDVDTLVSLKALDVTPEFVKSMRDAGIEVDADVAVELKALQVTPEFVFDMRELGFEFEHGDIAAMKAHNLTAEYVKGMRSAGFEPDADQIIAMKVHGVSPEYVQKMRALGFEPDEDAIVAMKLHGVSPEYVQQMRKLGFTPDTDEIIAMKVHNVSPEYVHQLRGAGFQPDTDEIINMKVHNVTPEFRQSLEKLGLELDTDQLITAKVMDVTPEFIAKARSHGFKNLDIDKLIALKHADVL
jgi:beta-lactamase regulating signal transducer with metallopeptidase domain